MRFKKVAIVHDVFLEFGGAERVLLSIVSLFPSADIYIPFINSEGQQLLRQKTSGEVYTSLFNNIPFISPASIILKPFLYFYWESLDFSDYDLVISSSHTFSSKSVITGSNTFHLSYVHTSPKYLYAELDDTRVNKSYYQKIICLPLFSWLRKQDFLGAQRPDLIVVNSQVVQKRVQKYYRRNSVVICPPVKIPFIKQKKHKTYKYFLCFSRLAEPKGIDLAIKTFNELKKPLLIVGKGSQERYLRSISSKFISFKGFVPDDQLEHIFSQAYALINCARDEDFGLVNVEALSYGIPVIGYNSGAISEIVTSKTGVLFDEYSKKGLKRAVQQFQKRHFLAQDCLIRARKFSEKLFFEKLTQLIEKQGLYEK